MEPLKSGDLVRVVKGNRARDTHASQVWTVSEIKELGKDYGYQVKVCLSQLSGRTVAWYARHINRLSDKRINFNDGNPLHKIQIERR